MISSKMIYSATCVITILILLILSQSSLLAQDFDCSKEAIFFSPDSSEYKQTKKYEARNMQDLASDCSLPIGEALQITDSKSPHQTSAIGIFCTEADCDNIQVTFAGITHPTPLNCSNSIGFNNIPDGDYSYTAVGCGYTWKGYFHVDHYSVYRERLCPLYHDTECCSTMVSCGSFTCSKCRSIPTTTTTSIRRDIIIRNHIMAKDWIQGTGCSEPTPNYSYDQTDSSAYSWILFSNSIEGDVFKWQWYAPDSSLYLEDTHVMTFTGNGCTWNNIDIWFSDPARMPGKWHVDIFFNDDFQFTENFTIERRACALTQIYGDDSEQAQLLRYFRDNLLNATQEGQKIIKHYYLWNPALVRAIEDRKFREEVKEMIDSILPVIKKMVDSN